MAEHDYAPDFFGGDGDTGGVSVKSLTLAEAALQLGVDRSTLLRRIQKVIAGRRMKAFPRPLRSYRIPMSWWLRFKKLDYRPTPVVRMDSETLRPDLFEVSKRLAARREAPPKSSPAKKKTASESGRAGRPNGRPYTNGGAS